MLNMLKSLLNEIKKNGLFPMFSHRNIVIVGFIVLITYLFGIDYYPTNISIETGITIFLISYISGALYITLWSAIISLGWGVFYLVNKYIPSKKTCLLEMIGDTLKIDLADHEEKKPRAIFALAFLVYLIFSTKWWMSILVITASTVVYGAIVMLTFVIKTQNKPGFRAPYEYFPPLLLHITILFFLIIPISMAVIYDFANIGQFTEKTMEIVGIRIQNKDIYIKAPYGELFAANSGNTTPVGNNFIILKNATILLNDIGGETLISYGDAKTAKRLSIPSSYVSIGEIYDLNKEPSLPREPSAVGSQK